MDFLQDKLLKAFPSLKFRNYRLYFISQLISLIGTWIQNVAQGWLVFELTHSAIWVGIVTGLGFLPVLFLGLFGGVIVDRLNKQKLFIFTQAGAMVLALLLAFLTFLGIINVFIVALLAFLLGCINALDFPVRQAVVVDLVDKESVHSAIALSAGVFNGARIIGPAIAGGLIAYLGNAGAFFVNALTYVAPIIALSMMILPHQQKDHHPPALKSIKQGLNYTFSHPLILPILIYVSISAVFGWSYMTIMPVIAARIFSQGAAGLGYLNSAIGLGAVLGAIFISSQSKKYSPQLLILVGGILFSVSTFIFSTTGNFDLSLFILIFTGVGLAVQNTTLQTTVQKNIQYDFRGRVMSIYTLMFIGLSPLGSVLIGFMTEHWGAQTALKINSTVILLTAIILYFHLKNKKETKG